MNDCPSWSQTTTIGVAVAAPARPLRRSPCGSACRRNHDPTADRRPCRSSRGRVTRRRRRPPRRRSPPNRTPSFPCCAGPRAAARSPRSAPRTTDPSRRSRARTTKCQQVAGAHRPHEAAPETREEPVARVVPGSGRDRRQDEHPVAPDDGRCLTVSRNLDLPAHVLGLAPARRRVAGRRGPGCQRSAPLRPVAGIGRRPASDCPAAGAARPATQGQRERGQEQTERKGLHHHFVTASGDVQHQPSVPDRRTPTRPAPGYYGHRRLHTTLNEQSQ